MTVNNVDVFYATFVEAGTLENISLQRERSRVLSNLCPQLPTRGSPHTLFASLDPTLSLLYEVRN